MNPMSKHTRCYDMAVFMVKVALLFSFFIGGSYPKTSASINLMMTLALLAFDTEKFNRYGLQVFAPFPISTSDWNKPMV